MRPRTLAAVWSAKIAAGASRALGRGGGTAVGGVAGLWVEPGLVRELARGLDEGCVLVTGTNGKTTTSSMIAAMAEAGGLTPVANASGSNLMRGVASTLALAAGPDGRLGGDHRLGVFEIDEATIPAALTDLAPRAIVFNNLFRDQLDRYGEVDAIAARWRKAIAAAPKDTVLVLNADDPTVASLGEDSERSVIYFGVNDPALDRGRVDHAADALTCNCGAALGYGIAYYSHVGHWRCPACGRARPNTQVTAKNVRLFDGHRLAFSLPTRDGDAEVEIALGGLFNVYNALAAVAAATALGIEADAVLTALRGFAAAFGRQESFDVDGRCVEVLLAKNPAGLNQVLDALALAPAPPTALFVLNDDIQDGRDVSWIWDADFETTAGRFPRTFVAGHRAEDLALRLKYAGFAEASLEIEPDVAAALNRAIAATETGGSVAVVPTYTAMLTVRELLARRANRKEYWRR
jgi:UDP-N-acetylmuramyl tripeptide synthase